ncbi:MAG: hypothetical protein R3C49_20115 [Planctomycetaceae bacterium]
MILLNDRFCVRLFSLAGLMLLSSVGLSDDAKSAAETTESGASEQEYVRIRRSEKRTAQALETSIVRLGESRKYPGATVDLIGAIHLGENQYYETLNRQFRQYDVLLFEAVMPERAVRMGLRPGGGKGSKRILDPDQQWSEAKVGLQAVSVLQLGMKDVLGLDFQLSAVDYTVDNFVHADMTQEEFESCMARRGETFTGILAQEMVKATLEQQKHNPVAQQLDVVLSLLASDRIYRLRRLAAVELTKANAGTAFGGVDGTSTIITERNRRALEVLKEQLQKNVRNIGIFYGAGHFPDMEKRMVEDFGFRRVGESWLTAWHLTAPETSTDK